MNDELPMTVQAIATARKVPKSHQYALLEAYERGHARGSQVERDKVSDFLSNYGVSMVRQVGFD